MVINPRKKRKIYSENYIRQEKILYDKIEKKIFEYNALMDKYTSLINKKIDLINQLNFAIVNLEDESICYEKKVKLLKLFLELKSKTEKEINDLNLLENKIKHSIMLYKK